MLRKLLEKQKRISKMCVECDTLNKNVLVWREVDIGLPGNLNPNSEGAKLVHQIVLMRKWIRSSRLSTKNSLSLGLQIAHDNIMSLLPRTPTPVEVALESLACNFLLVSVAHTEHSPPRDAASAPGAPSTLSPQP